MPNACKTRYRPSNKELLIITQRENGSLDTRGYLNLGIDSPTIIGYKMIEVKKENKNCANSTDKLLGQRVRTMRVLRNRSQAQLADGLGVTFQQIQKYEKGLNRISASRLLDIANILETNINYFFQGLSNEDTFLEKKLRLRDKKQATLLIGIKKLNQLAEEIGEIL